MSRDNIVLSTWGRGNNASKATRIEEVPVEQRVSNVLGATRLLFLSVPDAAGRHSLRGFIERNAIALLSNFWREPLDLPSATWLGHHSDRERVRRSGLWNSNHVDEQHDSGFLLVLERTIRAMERGE